MLYFCQGPDVCISPPQLEPILDLVLVILPTFLKQQDSHQSEEHPNSAKRYQKHQQERASSQVCCTNRHTQVSFVQVELFRHLLPQAEEALEASAEQQPREHYQH
uniref:Uncharacterized protein n=1 Tax=Opuntia streptacantha TaxID=393608 RepID=A0A7C9AMT5_OPUST